MYKTLYRRSEEMRPTHLIVLLIVIILVFGAPKLPAIAGSIVEALKVFRRGAKELVEENEHDSTKESA